MLFPCSDAGDLLFCGRKWIDPADPEGRTKLDLHHFNLCALFPEFAAACPHDRFIAAIAAVTESWARPTQAVEPARCRTIADFAPDSPALSSSSVGPRRVAGESANADPPTGDAESTAELSVAGSEEELASTSARGRADVETEGGQARSCAEAIAQTRGQKKRRKSG
jgi:hypothetical protein